MYKKRYSRGRGIETEGIGSSCKEERQWVSEAIRESGGGGEGR